MSRLEATVNILHISDIHFGCPDPRGEQARITAALKNAAHAHADKVGRKPDLCVFSGDLAFSGTPDQFEEGLIWLQELLAPWEDCCLFMVPGNHEVIRPQEIGNKKSPNKILRSASESEDTYNRWREDVAKQTPLNGFFHWHKTAMRDDLRLISDWSDSPFACSSLHQVGKTAVRLIGLNTALLSLDDSDREKLVVDIRRLNELLGQANHNRELVISVSHHPIGSFLKPSAERWLAHWNDEEVTKLLCQQTGAHLYLHGHLHDAESSTQAFGSGRFLTTLAAGAAYQGSRWEQKFAFYEVDCGWQTIFPTVFSFKNDSGEWYKEPAESIRFRAILPLDTAPDRMDVEKLVVDLEAYKFRSRHLEKALGLLAKRIYRPGDIPRHFIKRVYHRCYVEANGDCTVHLQTTLTPSSDEPINYWETWIEADPEAPPQSFIDLALQVADPLGIEQDPLDVPIVDKPRYKSLGVLFTPPIQPGTDRTVDVRYRWPGFLRHFLSGKPVTFFWQYNGSPQDETSELKVVIVFDSRIGGVTCEAQGPSPQPDVPCRSVSAAGKTTWSYHLSETRLAFPHKLVFTRCVGESIK